MAGNLTFNVDANDQASGTFAAVAAELKQLGRELDKIDGRNVKAKVTVNTPGVGVIAQLDQARAAIAEIDGKNARARVDVAGVPDAATVRQLRATAKALRELDGRNVDTRINIVGDLPDPKALRAAARALKDLQDVHQIDIHISITGAVEALAQVSRLRQELRAIPRETTTTVNVDVDKGLLTRISGIGSALAKIGALGGVAAAGAGSATASIATLAGSLASLAGLAPVAAGALASIGAVGVALGAGMAHVADALGPRDTAAQLKKVNQAMEQLAPAARETVLQVRELGAEWFKMRLDVQQKLFQGLSGSVREAGSVYIPLLKQNLGGITTEFNAIGKNVLAFATTARTITDVNTIFDNTRVALHNAAPAANNLLGTFRDIAVVGSDFLPGLATGWTNATQRFQTFINEARQSGQLKVWIQGGIDTLKTLGSITGNVGSALMSVFTAAKASGADFLSTLDKVTGKLADLLSSSTGQSALTAFFRESRQAVDALLPGVEALATGALKMIQSFSNSGAILNLSQTLSQLAQTVGPLGSAIGAIAGSTLNALTSGAHLAYSAVAPLVGVFGSIADGASGLIGPILAAVLAFKALSSAAVAGSFAALSARLTALAPLMSTYVAGLTGSLAAGAAAQTATSKFATAIGKLGTALPIVGVALIAIGYAYDAARDKSEDFAQSVIAGTDTMASGLKKTQDQFEGFSGWWTGVIDNLFNGDLVNNNFNGTMDEAARATENFKAKIEQSIQAMPALEGAQTRVKISTQNLADQILRYGPNSQQAADASAVLARDTADLASKQALLKGALKDTTEGLKAQADQMNSQIDTALAYSQAVQRTADAQRAANDALKNSGAKSDEYKGNVLALAAAMSSQADAARKQAEALGGTEAGVQAYNTEILRTADLSTQAGRDAFAQLTAGLDDAGLAAITSAAKLSGLRTEIVTLPDGRKVTVVVEADRGKLDSVKQGVEDLAAKKYIGNIEIIASVDGAQGSIIQTLRLADGSTATLKIFADGSPALLTVGQTKYTVDQTTGTIKVLGDVAQGEADLSGLKVMYDNTTLKWVVVPETGPAEANLNLTARPRDSNVTAVPFTAAAGTALDTTANPRTAPITGLPLVGTAESSLNNTSRPRTSNVTAVPSTGAAEAALRNLARTRYATIVVTTVGGGTANLGSASSAIRGAGAYAVPRAAGAYAEPAAYAMGGMRPMRADRAEIVPARQPRIIGDRMVGPEAFIPILPGSRRSQQILEQAVQGMGRQLVPVGADAGMAGRIASALGPTRGGGTTITNTFHATFTSTVPTGSVEVRKAIAWLNEELRKYNRDGK